MTTKRRAATATATTAKSTKDSGDDIAGVRLSHPDKVLYPEEDFTKLDLAHYYEQAAEWMLPHVENRLLSLVRCPAGSGQKCFFQKHPGEGMSEDLPRFDVTEKEGPEEYIAVNDLPGLISLVQMGVLEIHQWGSTADKYEKPDRLIFDLDPDPAVKWPQVVTAAKEVKLLLEELDLVSFVKTTGGKGLHIVVPINRRIDWDGAKEFCKTLADFLVAAAPDRYIAKMSKAARKGKIFVDYLRNDRGATAIAPYSTRARPGATVSVPIKWEELTNRLTSDHFTIKNLPSRLSRLKSDPWADMLTTKQNITAAMLKRLKSI
jgi:bifunctional non-homologous end joining protein LigD